MASQWLRRTSAKADCFSLAPKSPSARSLTAIVDFAVASHARAVALLLAVALLCFLPGFFSIPPIDRDEPRFAQATKQMVESGDYIDIRFQDEVRYKKPVGIYWLQAGVVKAGPTFEMTIWNAEVLGPVLSLPPHAASARVAITARVGSRRLQSDIHSLRVIG